MKQRRCQRFVGLVVLVGAILVAPAGAALAHPLGNFTTNVYAGMVVSADAIEVDVVLDLAEVPTFQTIERLGRASDGGLAAADAQGFASAQCADLAANLELDVAGDSPPLRVKATDLSFPPGEAGLDTLRLECRLAADLAEGAGERSVSLVDRNFPRRLGWREITATGDGVAITSSDVPGESISDRLIAYPEERVQSPLDVREAHLVARPGGAAPGIDPLPADPGGSVIGGLEQLTASFTSLVSAQDPTVAFMFLAFGTALALGAVHALAPGHGKTVMAAYLVGSRGTTREALGLGVTVAVTHTMGVFGLGLVLSASQTAAPERVYPYLGLASGLLFAGVGVLLLRRAVKSSRHGHGHDHGHGHGHDHDHGRDHHHGAPLTWRTMLAPGLAGGLLPSPSALVVLLGGIAIGRAWFGATLVVAYGIGMAVTLVGAGYLLLKARNRFAAARPAVDGRWARISGALPVITSALIIVGGLVIAVRSVGTI